MIWQTYYPLIIIGGILGVFATIFIIAYALIKDKKESMGFERNISDKEIVKRLLAYAKPHWKSFALVLALMLFSISYDIIAPYLIGNIQGIIKTDFALEVLFWRIGLYASILVITMLCSYMQSITLQKIGQKIISNIRLDLFEHIEKLSHEQLNHIPVGKLVTRVTNDTNGVSMMFTNLIVNLIKNVFVILGVLVAMLCLNYMLTLMVLCFVPFIVLFTVIFRKFSRRAYRKVKDCTTDINTFLSENLSGIKITQFFNQEEKKLSEFAQKNEKLGKAKYKQIFVFGIFRPMVFVLYQASVLTLFFLGAKGVLDNKAILGQIVTSDIIVSFYMYISKFFNPIQSLAEQFNWLQSALASAEKIFTIMDMQPIIVDSDDAVELSNVQGKIEFKNVWFAYNEGEWVLKDVSFTIEPKQTVAFVGSTGSGKTTILSLICRNYDIQKGQILIDGMDIKKIKISSLRKHFGQMLQDVFLFSGTIRENILLREEGISDEEVWKTRMALKTKLIDYIREQFRDSWLKNQGDPSRVVSLMDKINPNALLIGFGRRFATYKRAHLLFTDLERLEKIVNNPNYPVQFLYTGKAHPADGAGQGLIKRIYEISQMPQFLGKIIFLENYDMQLARRLISGVDIWMNTPTRPLEASGTSGEKALMNGVVNLSVLDGWWLEGYREGAGWALTEKRTYQNQAHQDQLDAATIYSLLENEIMPLYYARNSKGYSTGWVKVIKNSIATIAPHYTMKRQLDDYYSKFYNKLRDRGNALRANGNKLAKEIAAWKEEVATKWNDIKVLKVDACDALMNGQVEAGKEYNVKVVLDEAGLNDAVGVEIVTVHTDKDGNESIYSVEPMTMTAKNGNEFTFEGTHVLDNAGSYKSALRMFPKNENLPHRQDFCYVTWF